MDRSRAEFRLGMPRVASGLLAAVLLGAAVGKVFFLPVESRLGMFSYPGVLAGVVFLEVAAAAWFLWLAAAYPQVTRVGGCVLFGSFAVYSVWAWLRGEPCQCFGQTGISPLVPLAIDLAAIVLLLMPQSGARAFFGRAVSYLERLNGPASFCGTREGVILSSAKNPPSTTRSFAALRMTAARICPRITPGHLGPKNTPAPILSPPHRVVAREQTCAGTPPAENAWGVMKMSLLPGICRATKSHLPQLIRVLSYPSRGTSTAKKLGEGVRGRGRAQQSGMFITPAGAAWFRFATCVVVGLSLALWSLQRSPSQLTRAGEVLGSSRVVVLEPERWLNQPFPLLSHIESPADLGQGDWLVVLYRPDCSHCQQVIPELAACFSDSHSSPGFFRREPKALASVCAPDMSEPTAGRTSALALIDLSSQASVEWQIPSRIARGRLSPDWEWFVTPPVRVKLSDGLVRDVATVDVSRIDPGASSRLVLATSHGGLEP